MPEDAIIQPCRSSQVISDITVISDKTSQPPLLCLAQYFGVEDELHGGERTVQPWIIYLFYFAHRSWHVFDRHPPDSIYSSHVKNRGVARWRILGGGSKIFSEFFQKFCINS